MKIKKYWGVIPFGICAILLLAVSVFEKLTDSKLRSVPQMIVFWTLILSVILIAVWLSRKVFHSRRMKQLKGHEILKMVSYIILIIISCGGIFYGFVYSAFTYNPEHIIERNGIKMTACVNSFLQETVYYYEYKNIFFRGAEEIGYEDYGNGGGDPLEEGNSNPNRWYFNDLEGNQIESGGEN